MRRIAGAVGTAVLQILKWMLKIVLGALKLFLGLVRLWQWSLQRHRKLLMLTAYTKMQMKR